MILAAPLVIPFAKAVGISVATLGMAKAADMVNDYIQANPEESMKILSTIVPSIGIGQIFMNKEKISLEDLDEMTDEEAQDLSKEEKAELMKQAGKTGGSNKRQTMIDISEKLGLSGSGKEKQDIEYDIDERYDEGGVEEVSKPKFDYKKFFRNRRADGGRIGFEKGGETAPSGVFSLQEYVNFLNAADDYNRLLGEGEKLAGEAGEFVKSVGDKEYEDLTEKELLREKELEDKVENLEDRVFKTDEDYERKTRDLPEDEETMGAYARKLIDDVNERNRRFEELAGLMGLKKGGRVGFNLGGLTGPAKGIYDFMSAAGYFSDDEIRNAITAAGYEIPGESSPETTAPNIIGAQLNQGGGGGMTGLQKTYTKDLSGDPSFNYLTPQEQAVKYKFDTLAPTKESTLESLKLDSKFQPKKGIMGFFDKVGNKFKESKFFQPKIKGTLGTRLANRPKLPIPSFASFLSNYSSPFNLQSKNYNPLLESQLNFAETQEGIVGTDPNSGLLKYGPESVLSGKNVISMFGTNDYETALRNFISKMNANTKISNQRKAARLAQAEAELKALQAATEAAKQSQYGKIDYGKGSDGQQSYSGDAIGAGNLGFGIGATTGGPVSNKTGKGRTDYYKGGLASMFAEKR